MGSSNEKKGIDLNELIDTINSLDPQNIGSWPTIVKVLVYVGVFLGVLLLGYVLALSGKQSDLKNGVQEQQTLLGEFENKIFKARNLDTYKQQLKDMEDSFGALLRQLPKDTEVPGLLDDISQTGLGSGVEFDAIDLGEEVKKDFYVEQPINIKAHGDYHAFGAFISGLAALPRIVTLHDFRIDPSASASNKKTAGGNGGPVLSLSLQAKTYRYNQDASAGK